MYLPKNIRHLRKEKLLGQEQLANILGYKSYTTIQKWETGASEPPLKQVKKMADLFGVDIDDMAKRDLSLPSFESERTILRVDEKRLLENYNHLNAYGKERAYEYIEDLTVNEKYTEERSLDSKGTG